MLLLLIATLLLAGCTTRETQKLLDESLVINDETNPIYLQDLEVMEYYVEAVRKVLANLDELFV